MSKEPVDDPVLNTKYTLLFARRSKTKRSVFRNHPVEYRPHPQEQDYRRTLFERYFAVKSSDKNAPVIEIDSDQYNYFKKIPFYTTVGLTWKISGPLRNVVDEDGIFQYEGVYEYNSAQIRRARKVMPGIYKKVGSLLELYK